MQRMFPDNQITAVAKSSAFSHLKTCRPPPLRNDPHQKMIANGAQCSESNENMNTKFFRFLFFELSSKIGVIFSEK